MFAPEEIGLKQSIYIALKVHQDWWSLVPSTLLWTPHQLLAQVRPITRRKHYVIFKLFATQTMRRFHSVPVKSTRGRWNFKALSKYQVIQSYNYNYRYPFSNDKRTHCHHHQVTWKSIPKSPHFRIVIRWSRVHCQQTRLFSAIFKSK